MARPATQIHTHMCYAEFGDILDAVVALDADVISHGGGPRGMDMLEHLAGHRYPASVGPGVWDIHSPQVPSTAAHRRAARARRSRSSTPTSCG